MELNLAMKKLFLVLAFLLAPSFAWAQCTGVFPASSVCGTTSAGPGVPQVLPLASFALAPGGTSGNVQTNNGSGGLAGITNTQLTALLNTFTSSLSGAVPASGGNAAQFLNGAGVFSNATNVFATIAALRANTVAIPNVYVQGYTSVNDGGEGDLNYVSTDVTTADNNCTIFVDAGGHRYYRQDLSIVNVLKCGADKTGVSNATAAIRSAALVACPIGVNGLGRVYIPAGTYKVDGGVNLTGLNFGCIVYGDGPLSTVLQTSAGSATNAIVDLTGSAGVSIRDMQINALANTTGNVKYAFLIASTAAQGCDLMSLSNLYVPGYFSKGVAYIFGCTDGRMDLVQFTNNYASAAFVMYLGSTNAYSATSNFVTINPASIVPTGLWNFYTVELHETSGSGASNIEVLILNGSQSPNTWTGGVIAGSTTAAAGGLVTFSGGSGNTPTGSVFSGVQFYADNGTQAAYAFWANLSVAGLNVNGVTSLATTSLVACINGATWNGMNIIGNSLFSVPVISASGSNSCTVTGAYIDAQSQAVNVGSGGAISHSVLLRPGTITGTHGSDVGTF